ncbi:hypothetical protein BpHYR1_003146 [Brachionus plicatilis]|uniref:Uncharacterized protein n=1 Tax=Brachionus plicatilis TaxID=10195 RepID=A0A3M7QAJ1_BRAPC|nr:hypothetical protein BpHYR1_003146 [Brachionus plicatilis]
MTIFKRDISELNFPFRSVSIRTSCLKRKLSRSLSLRLEIFSALVDSVIRWIKMFRLKRLK